MTKKLEKINKKVKIDQKKKHFKRKRDIYFKKNLFK